MKDVLEEDVVMRSISKISMQKHRSLEFMDINVSGIFDGNQNTVKYKKEEEIKQEESEIMVSSLDD
jgi:hypothetical protein